MQPDYASMRTDMADVIADSAALCAITRNTGTMVSGRKTENYTSVASNEKVWIQAVSLTDRERQEQGIIEGTTHVGYQAHSGYAMQETDRILPSGETGPYEVIGVHVVSTHRKLFLKRVK